MIHHASKHIDTMVFAGGATGITASLLSEQITPLLPVIVGLMAPLVKEIAMYAVDKIAAAIRERREEIENKKCDCEK